MSAEPHRVELDLRGQAHLERSKLFHRLLLLDVRWAQPADAGRTRGTFREAWILQWRPEFDVALIEAGGGGTTIESAAAGVLVQRAAAGTDIAELSRLVEAALLCDLPDALDAVLAAMAERAARQYDTTVLMAAVEPLARIWRYGNVRRADTETVHRVLAGVVTRVAIGLPAVCAALDDDGAAQVRSGIDGVQRGVGISDDDGFRAQWQGALATVADQRGVHGIIGGRDPAAARWRGARDRRGRAAPLARPVARRAGQPGRGMGRGFPGRRRNVADPRAGAAGHHRRLGFDSGV